MFGQLFGRYLVSKNMISEEDLIKILEVQASTRVKLGTIAVADSLLTEEQALEINQLQMQMDKRFGDIAIEKGFLAEKQVKLLLSKQGNPYLQFLQILIENNDISILEIDKMLIPFQKENGFSDEEIKALKEDSIEVIVSLFAATSKPYVTDVVALVLRNITRFITTDYYIGRVKPVNSFEYDAMTVQNLTGDHKITLGFAYEKEEDAFLKIAHSFANEESFPKREEVYDAVGEFINCINGLFATELSKKNIEIELSAPQSYEKQVTEGSAYILPIYFGKDMVQLYIAVDSEVTLGTKPLVFEEEIKSSTIVNENSKGKVVITDDSKMSRNVLRHILEEQGYTIVGEATNGLEAIEAYKQYSPDVITLDITMPKMDGLEALKHIIEYDKTAKVIMITAAGQQQKVLEAIKSGASKFVAKPFDKEEIIKNLEELIQKI